MRDADTAALANTAVTPRPTDAGVFGMDRTMAVPGAKWRASEATVRPAATDSTTVPGPASLATGGSTSSMICGLTASTITAAGAACTGGVA